MILVQGTRPPQWGVQRTSYANHDASKRKQQHARKHVLFGTAQAEVDGKRSIPANCKTHESVTELRRQVPGSKENSLREDVPGGFTVVVLVAPLQKDLTDSRDTHS